MAPCPRCRRENPPTAVACAGCGTPLSFEDDPAPRPLAVELDLDRRKPGREPEGPEDSPEEDAGAAADEDVRGDDVSDEDFGEEDVGEEEGDDPEDDGVSDPSAGEVASASSGEEGLQPASPARRAAAWAIDGALVAALAVAVPALLVATGGVAAGEGPPLRLVLPAEGFVAVVAFVYATVAHALAGATLGKRVARIRVVGADGRPPGIACSASRSAWAAASLLVAGAGMIPALVSPSRRALHDLLAGTRVVDA